jgi:hypothetical protein
MGVSPICWEYDGDNDGNGLKRDLCRTPKDEIPDKSQARLAIFNGAEAVHATPPTTRPCSASGLLTSINLWGPVEPCNRLTGVSLYAASGDSGQRRHSAFPAQLSFRALFLVHMATNTKASPRYMHYCT